MTLISAADRGKVKEILSSMANPVTVTLFTKSDGCDYCTETRQLLEELAELSSGKISLSVHDVDKEQAKAAELNIHEAPVTLIGDKTTGVRYYGIPSGYEFSSLLEDLVDSSRGGTRLAEETRRAVRDIKTPVHIRVFVTPTCPYCPRAVRTAHQFAMENPVIRADMVESMEFPDLANKYEVMAVPKIVINDAVSFEGAMPEQFFLEQIMEAQGAAKE